MASFLCEMADVISRVKYAHEIVQEIEFQQGWEYSRFVPGDGLSADAVYVLWLDYDQIRYFPESSFCQRKSILQ